MNAVFCAPTSFFALAILEAGGALGMLGGRIAIGDRGRCRRCVAGAAATGVAAAGSR